ncbi:MAG: RNA-binding protein [Lysobacterales bacterium 69-70]|jgi:RNA-binding protein|nr:ribosome assembly RNA-binding protein YhbY [Xanthomonadaceae bacterium]ODU31965.1 MAG: RNA-binding protein [Xanthomonadaceae bacterium SCN 69-320]ODV20022.1 MAG: RNA-binding protein [Xanthomonadaceae bacterium SCN 69-25]OJZ01690.1 MAG: RNA-binding protein [Xanthomonadales bacterium 69-70]
MPLSNSQRRYLRGLAHDLKPVILVGAKGVTEALIQEFGLALDHHELVKVRIPAEDREDFAALAAKLAEASAAETVQTIGRTAVFYRRNAEKPVIALPR